MWTPTPSSSTTSSSDNKHHIKEVVDINACKFSGKVEQLDNSIQRISTLGSLLSDSTNIQEHQKNGLEEAEETIDSGFISEPQALSSTILDTDNEVSRITSGNIKTIDIAKSVSESHNTIQQEQLNFTSGIVEEESDDGVCDLEKQKNQSNEQQKMMLPNSVDAGLSEWFCNLSLQNNLNDNTTSSHTNRSMPVASSGLNNLDPLKQQQQSSVVQQAKPCCETSTVQQYQQQTATIPQQITVTNAWEKYYQQNDDGDTLLHLACISGSESIVAALIRMAPHPCLFNIRNDEAQTPMHLATLTVHPKIIRMLLIAGAKTTVRDRYGNTALHLACISGEEECVRALIIPISASELNEAHRQYGYRANDKSYLKYTQLPSDLEIRNYDGERCVHLAAQAGFINILRLLVLYGADINAREGKSGRTPLHIAIESCNEELPNYILDDCHKLNLETATYAGLTAYQMAYVLNKSEMQTILEKRGAEPLTPPDSDYDSSDIEIDLEDDSIMSRKKYYPNFSN